MSDVELKEPGKRSNVKGELTRPTGGSCAIRLYTRVGAAWVDVMRARSDAARAGNKGGSMPGRGGNAPDVGDMGGSSER